jgi:hypothetical protein
MELQGSASAKDSNSRYVTTVLSYLQLTHLLQHGFAHLMKEFERLEAFAIASRVPPSGRPELLRLVQG